MSKSPARHVAARLGLVKRSEDNSRRRTWPYVAAGVGAGLLGLGGLALRRRSLLATAGRSTRPRPTAPSPATQQSPQVAAPPPTTQQRSYGDRLMGVPPPGGWTPERLEELTGHASAQYWKPQYGFGYDDYTRSLSTAQRAEWGARLAKEFPELKQMGKTGEFFDFSILNAVDAKGNVLSPVGDHRITQVIEPALGVPGGSPLFYGRVRVTEV